MMTTWNNSGVAYRLGTYLITAGGASLAAGSVNAAEVQISDANAHTTIVVDTGNNGVDIDVDGGGYDLSFQVYDSGPGNPGYISIQGAGNSVIHVSQRGTCSAGAYYAGNVAAGSVIDATLFSSPTPVGWGFVWSPTRIADCNNFITDQWGYLAFRMGTTPNYNYGYLKVRRRSGSNILDIDGGAYQNTTNAAISVPLAAVNAIAVPVGPSVPVGIGLLIAGAAAMRLRRQNKTH